MARFPRVTMEGNQMTTKLIYLIAIAAALAAGLLLLCQLVFPDVGPYKVGENEVISWQRQVAVLMTATAWVCAEVSGLFSILLAAHLTRQHMLKKR
jgi:hypothetical protein